jgi:hypothetical protein
MVEAETVGMLVFRACGETREQQTPGKRNATNANAVMRREGERQ